MSLTRKLSLAGAASLALVGLSFLFIRGWAERCPPSREKGAELSGEPKHPEPSGDGPAERVRHEIPEKSGPAENRPERVDLLSGGTVRGVVLVRGSREPIRDARVSYTKAGRATSDPWDFSQDVTGVPTLADGTFILEGIPEGTIDLSVYHSQYALGTVLGVEVRPGEATDVTVELHPCGGIRGTVTRAGRPAEGYVAVRKPDDPSQPAQDSWTDSQGSFEIRGLSAGQYELTLSWRTDEQSSGRLQVVGNRKVTVFEGQVSEVEIAEPECRRIHVRGQVTSRGEPFAGASIQAAEATQPERGSSGDRAEVDSKGLYSLELPGPGSYSLFLEGRGIGRVKVDLSVPEGVTELRRDIELPSGEISGTVVDARTGSPLAGCQVMAMAADSSFRSMRSFRRGMQAMADTDVSGRFSLSHLPPGSYCLRAFARRYAEGRLDGIRIEDGRGSLENRILLERGISCRARVVDIRGEPIAQARAILRDQSGELASFSSHAPSNRDGILQLPDVRAGRYRMMVSHGSYAPSSIDMMVARDSDPVTVTLSPGGKLRISVFDRQGLPVKSPEIDVLDEEGENVAEDMSLDSPLQYAMSGIDEPLVFGPLLPGSYRVAAKKGKSQSRPEKITVVEGETSEIRLSLEE